MIITKLELINFGGLKHLEVDTGVPVVGILGKNGAGKSTVLKGIGFAFTGKLDGGQKTWIRNGAKSADVNIWFTKMGKEVVIKRHLTLTTSSRKLIYDGREIKGAKEIEKIFEEIFGNDKEAISSAVFIPQGELNNMLFEGAAARYALFIKILTLSFCERYSGMLLKRADKLLTGIVDLTSNLDILRGQAQDSSTNVVDIAAEFASVSGYKPQYTWFMAAKTCTAQLEHCLAQWTETEREHKHLAKTLEDTTKLTDELAAFEDNRDSISKGIEAIKYTRSQVVSYNAIEEKIKNQEETYKVTEMVMKDIDSKGWNGETLAVLKCDKVSFTEQQNLRNNVAIFARDLAGATTRLEAINKEDPGITETMLKELFEHWTRLVQEYKVMNAHLIMQQKILAGGGCNEENCCMECGLKLAETPTEKEVTELEQLVATKNTDMQKVGSEHTAKKEQRDSWVHDIENATSTLQAIHLDFDTVSQKLASIVDTVVERDFDADIQEMEEGLQGRRGAVTLCDFIKKELETLHAEADVIHKTGVLDSVATVEFMDKSLVGYEASLVKIGVTIDQKRAELTAATEHKAMCDAVFEQQKKLAVDVKQARAKRDELNDNNPIKDFESKSHAEWEMTLKTRAEEEDQVLGKLNEARSTSEGIEAQMADIQMRMDTNRDKVQIAEELRDVSDVFKKDGLPMAYVNDRFVEIAEMTQENLGLLEADFVVAIDSERPLSFTFERLDGDSDGGPLPQEKMSGGQRVKMSVAFLMAIQQLLLPDFGFLVLDEPTQHLDEDAKEQLANLLINISKVLQNTESQIFVCDHSPPLERAFNKTIKLTYGQQ